MSARRTRYTQRGVALITSLLLLMIITIIALSMFRGFAIQERVAGNLRRLLESVGLRRRARDVTPPDPLDYAREVTA